MHVNTIQFPGPYGIEAMRISRVIINNFRNFKSLDVKFGEHAVILGENGSVAFSKLRSATVDPDEQ